MAADKISGIYEIVNTITGKRYVGSAVNIRVRRNQHFRRLRKGDHHSTHLQSAWNKYGEAAFQFRLLLECSKDDLLIEEQKQIDRKSEYNMTKGAGSCLGRPVSLETRKKIAEAHMGRKLGPRGEEHRRLLSEANKGKSKSDAHMNALQQARRAYEFTEEDRQARSEGMKRAYAEGKREREKSPDHRAKIAETLKGRTPTDEARRNQSVAQTGKKRGKYKLNPEKSAARREAGKRLAAITNARRWGISAE